MSIEHLKPYMREMNDEKVEMIVKWLEEQTVLVPMLDGFGAGYVLNPDPTSVIIVQAIRYLQNKNQPKEAA